MPGIVIVLQCTLHTDNIYDSIWLLRIKFAGGLNYNNKLNKKKPDITIVSRIVVVIFFLYFFEAIFSSCFRKNVWKKNTLRNYNPICKEKTEHRITLGDDMVITVSFS